MRLRGAINRIDFQSSSGTVIPNVTSLEYDKEAEIRFYLKDVNLPDAMKPFLVSGLQDPLGGIEAVNVVPARTGRYRARCTRHGGERVFIPDLQIAAELNAASTFEYGGVDWFQKNDQILVMLGWVEIVQAQIERRVPKVDACGTLTARGYPFLTDNMKQILTEDSHREKFDLIHEPFEKLERSSTPADCCKITSRTRSKSFDGIPGAKCIGFHDELNGNYSRSSVSFLGIPDPRLQAVTSASFDPFYNAFLQPPTPGANRSGCHCFRL